MNFYLALLWTFVLFSFPSQLMGAYQPPEHGSEYGSDKASCQRCELTHNYDGHYSTGQAESYEVKKSSRVCTTSTDYFANECWLDLYNQVFAAGLTVAPDEVCSNLTGELGSCPCKALCANINNPLCVLEVSTGQEVTVSNYCQYKCGIGCNFGREIKHCGPCQSDNSTAPNECDGNNQLNCIPSPPRPLPPCGNQNFTSCCRRPCAPTFDQVCGRNIKTGQMVTFRNECFLNCQVDCNPDWQAFGPHGPCQCQQNDQPPEDGSDQESCQKCEMTQNYDGPYSTGQTGSYEVEKSSKVCTTSTDYFANECWLDLYNQVFAAGLTVAPDEVCSNLTGKMGSCPCRELCVNTNNSLCVLEVSTGQEVTVSNYCQYKCGIGCNFDREIKHCGPCQSDHSTVPNECGGNNQLNCIPSPPRPLPPCGNQNFTTCCRKPCAPIFDQLCGRNIKTGQMVTFRNECFLNCQVECNPDWQPFGAHGPCQCQG